MPDAVVEAIRTHTTAAEHMTLVQKILYVADLCEETRTYPGAAQLRALALTDLEEAYIAALRRTLTFVRSQGRTPYYKTELALRAALQTPEKEETT